jgi:Holliday junction DNA helicase RuvB
MGIFTPKTQTPIAVDEAIRPLSWNDYIGQEKMKATLSMRIAAAKQAGRRPDHMLIVGPPGSGKTSLAGVVANELGVNLYEFMMPVDVRQLQRLFLDNKARGVVFFDEFHRAKPAIQELFLTMIEDDYMEIPGTNRRIYLGGHFMFILATTEAKDVLPTIYDRCPIKPSFEVYSTEEMGRIVKRMADLKGVKISDEAAVRLGRATGGTPRNAKNIVFTMRDLQQTGGDDSVENVLFNCELTADGLTPNHVKYLRVLEGAGGPVGVKLIGTHLQLPESVIMDLERLLFDLGMIEYTQKGRQLIKTNLPEGIDNGSFFE